MNYNVHDHQLQRTARKRIVYLAQLTHDDREEETKDARDSGWQDTRNEGERVCIGIGPRL